MEKKNKEIEYLLAEKRNNYGWPPVQKAARGGPSTAVMDDDGDALKKPLMRTVSQVENVPVLVPDLISAQLAPPPGDDSPDARGLDGLQQRGVERLWVVDDDAPEPNVDWRRASFKEFG